MTSLVEEAKHTDEPGWLKRVGYAFWDPLGVVASRKAGRRHLLKRALTAGAIEAATFLLMVWLVPGIEVSDLGSAIIATAAVALLNALLRPALLQLTLGLTVLTLGLFSLVLNALVLALAAWLVSGFRIDGFWSALIGTLVLTLVNYVLSSLFHVSDDDSFYLSLVKRAARRRGRAQIEADHPGLLVVSIDGLSEPVLRFAIRTGAMPTLARWVREGSHRIAPWECELPSQTSASQAGLLYGDNFDIPAFRWYEKDRKRRMVSNSPRDAAEIARRISTGEGLAAHGGTTVATLLGGDAERTPLVMGALHERVQIRADDFYAYFVSPYNFTRSLVLSIREVFRELSQARAQRARDVFPRVKRDLKFALLRGGTNVLMRDLTTAVVVDNVFAGTPVIYANYLAYDEVAHHAGPERPEALEELRRLDEAISFIERGEAMAGRDYGIVVLSDHGQSQGATFLQRHGYSLDDYVRELIGPDHTVSDSIGTTEGWANVNAVTTEAINSADPVTRRALNGVLKARMHDGVAEFGPDARKSNEEGPDDEAVDVVVSASGNLGLVHFGAFPERLSRELIDVAFPRLIDGLAAHEGIGFLLVRSEQDGALVIGADGVRYLEDDRVEGEDPLADFGPLAANHLRRLDQFPHCGDIVVNSSYDTATDEVAAFEELVGSHGGLGGPQTKAFVLFPAEWDAPGELVGAPAVHRALCMWRDRIGALG
jgi:uncharacterized membrane protein YvlD (DUF360 family)